MDTTPRASDGSPDPDATTAASIQPRSGATASPSTEARPATAPAGWYPNPQGPGQRWWDGAQWTDHYSAPASPQTTAAASSTTRPGSFWIAVGGLAAMVIGAFGPWVTALGGAVSVNGTSGGRDGWLLLGAALIAGAFLLTYFTRGITSRLTGTAVFAVLGGLVCVVDLVDISNRYANVLGTNVQVADPGWGIYLGLAGSAALAVAAVVLRQRETTR